MGCTFSSKQIAVIKQPIHIKPLDILVVDKSLPVLKLIEMTFKKAGHNVTITSSGYNAIELIKTKWINEQSIYQVILFDLNMPFEGDYYTNIIKHKLEDKLESNEQKLPTLFIIGTSNKLKICCEFEFDKMLIKPFTLQDFNNTIQNSKHLVHYKTHFKTDS